MADVVVTCPRYLWNDWLEEGDLPGEAPTGDEYVFYLGGAVPQIQPGERVYICAHGKLRGYAPLIALDRYSSGRFALRRAGGAVACTIAEPIQGFRGWRYRHWRREDELPFPDWRTP